MSGQSFPQDVVAGTQLVTPSIHSPDYVQGTSGWTVNLDGSAEFNNLTIRGTFNGNDFIVNSNGAFFYAPSEAFGNLIVSIASSAGTDSFGNSYPEGINVTAGTISGTSISAASISGGTISGTSISGGTVSGSTVSGGTISGAVISSTEFDGTDFTIDSSGAFFYNGTPGFGNLVASISAAAGTDPYGNSYAQGFYASSSFGITTGNVYMNPTMGIPPNYPLSTTVPTDNNSGTGWVSGERAFMNNNWVAAINNISSCLNTLIQEMQNRGFITP